LSPLHRLLERIALVPILGAPFVKQVREIQDIVHRWRFFLCYFYHNKRVFRRKALEEVVCVAFKHPRFTRAVVRIYPSLGARRGEEWRIYWGAPITVTVWFDKVPVVGMALDVKFGSLCIWQLQGSRQLDGTQLPKLPSDIPPWPQLFVEATMKFAKQQGFKEVLLRRAEHLSYWPSCSNLRSRLKTIHDTTAKRLGFTRGKFWWEWKVGSGDNNMICQVCQGSQNLFWSINKRCAPHEIKNIKYHWITCPACQGLGTYLTYGPAVIQAKQKR
jgi:hypothetical protein